MNVVITSMRQNAGKTTMIIGIAGVLQKKAGYAKPFGDRLVYRKKRLWDYDAALLTNLLDLTDNPEDMSIGFHHSKLLYMLDEKGTREKLRETLSRIGRDKEIIFIETGKDITYGSAVHLDAISVAKDIDGQLLVILSGSEDTILDDMVFLKKYIKLENIVKVGVIINKVTDYDEFKTIYLPKISESGIPVYGVIPYDQTLQYFSVRSIADHLFAKIIAGEGDLDKKVKNIFYAPMSVEVALKDPLFRNRENVVVTSGDRSDIIIAALENHATAIVLTDGIVPSTNLISRSNEQGIPLLLVSLNIHQISEQIDLLEPLPTRDDQDKISTIIKLIREHIDLSSLISS